MRRAQALVVVVVLNYYREITKLRRLSLYVCGAFGLPDDHRRVAKTFSWRPYRKKAENVEEDDDSDEKMRGMRAGRAYNIVLSGASLPCQRIHRRGLRRIFLSIENCIPLV